MQDVEVYAGVEDAWGAGSWISFSCVNLGSLLFIASKIHTIKIRLWF